MRNVDYDTYIDIITGCDYFKAKLRFDYFTKDIMTMSVNRAM